MNVNKFIDGEKMFSHELSNHGTNSGCSWFHGTMDSFCCKQSHNLMQLIMDCYNEKKVLEIRISNFLKQLLFH